MLHPPTGTTRPDYLYVAVNKANWNSRGGWSFCLHRLSFAEFLFAEFLFAKFLFAEFEFDLSVSLPGFGWLELDIAE